MRFDNITTVASTKDSSLNNLIVLTKRGLDKEPSDPGYIKNRLDKYGASKDVSDLHTEKRNNGDKAVF